MSTYATESALSSAADGQHLELATALGLTPTGLVDNPTFFSGFLARPDIAAAGLLAVADVAGTMYADFGLAKRIANLDPVVTSSGDRLRFESFSACNGVYARLDLLREGLGSGECGFGTTNIDINQPLRTALARVNRSEPLHLSVGKDELRASSLTGTHVERKVALPDRWVRGLAEVPAKSRAMTPSIQLTGPAIGRFLGGLPRIAPPGPTVHLIRLGGSIRTSNAALAGSVPLAGSARVRACDRLSRFATTLTVYAAADGCTGWVFALPGARFTLLLSPDPYRGFSGEGSLLLLLAQPEAELHGRRLLSALGWQPVIDPHQLSRATGMDEAQVTAGLGWLAGSGRLGFDLTEQAYFHRDLPVDSDAVLRRNPRLVSAQRLRDTGGVTAEDGGWLVRGSAGQHYLVSDEESLHCTCPWEAEHAEGRGPCKHILAVLLR
jgi:hypothetical protein